MASNKTTPKPCPICGADFCSVWGDAAAYHAAIHTTKSAADYLSRNVFDGKRPLAPEHSVRLRSLTDRTAERAGDLDPARRREGCSSPSREEDVVQEGPSSSLPQTTGFHYRLIRCGDDGALHGVELDDFQVTFDTRFDSGIGVTVGEIWIGLTGQQADIIKKWWREPDG